MRVIKKIFEGAFAHFLAFFVFGGICSAYSAEAMDQNRKFALTFLHGGSKKADLDAFLLDEKVKNGIFDVEVFLNLKSLGFQRVEFRSVEDVQGVACISQNLISKLGLDFDKIKSQNPGWKEKCIDLPVLIEGSKVNYNSEELELHLNIPQNNLVYVPKGTVPKDIWEEGITAGFSNYQLNSQVSKNNNISSTYTAMTLRNGFNVNGWRIRNDSNIVNGNSNSFKVSSNRTYAEHDITALNSQFTVGEAYTNSQIFDSFRFRGFQISSDDSMLPDGVRGYAPVIHGIADSNAVVEVRQNGYLLQSISVPPGSFTINDIYPSGSNGDLEVTIIEANGQRKVSYQNFSTLPQMLREDQTRFNMAVGNYASLNPDDPSPLFGTLGAARGLNNITTLFGGALIANDYSALNVGSTFNTYIGALSLDITKSKSEGRRANNEGQSLHFNYAKTLASTNTTFTLGSYRFSTEGYRTLSNHVEDLRNQYPDRILSPKSRTSVSISQSLGQKIGAFYVSAYEENYWRYTQKRSQFQVGYSTSMAGIGINISASKYKEAYANDNQNQFSISISVPLGSSPRSTNLYSSVSSFGQGKYAERVGLNGWTDKDSDSNYSVETYSDVNNKLSSSARATIDAGTSKLGVGYTTGDKFQSANFSAEGVAVVHAAGINFGKSVGDTFGLVQTGTVAGINVYRNKNIKTSSNGYAVLPNLEPYHYNWIKLDSSNMDSAFEVKNAIQRTVPRRGAIVLSKFDVVSGRRVQFQFVQANGEKIPFGAIVKNRLNERVSITDPQGMALALLDKDKGSVEVDWGSSHCTAHYELVEAQNTSMNFERIVVPCI